MTTEKEFGERLRGFRERAGLTRKQLSQKAKVSMETLFKAESGKQYLRIDTLLPINAALGCTTSELLGEGVDGEIADLKLANHQLAHSLMMAEMDLEKLDSCQVCAYANDGGCTAPKELKMGGSCFVWRGKVI